uniref:uncharacterized protein LOC122610279 n=1 Tax=Erigeron canadensis TaxID=72917 RepID=UPI001CB89D24|nr:uncharacterized protein LOC122610279 [Erigeron canadensis]
MELVQASHLFHRTAATRSPFIFDLTWLTNSSDTWTWKLDPSGSFTTKSMRCCLQNATFGPKTWPFPWNRLAPLKVNILGWRIEQNRLPIKDLLLQRNIAVTSPSCPICNNHDETVAHLFLHCQLADSLWTFLSLWCRLPLPKPSNLRELFDLHTTAEIDTRKKKFVNLVVLAYCWILWKTRNDLVFNNKVPSLRYAIKELKSLSFLWIAHRSPNNTIDWHKWNSFIF